MSRPRACNSRLVWLGRAMIAGAVFKMAATLVLGVRPDPAQLAFVLLVLAAGVVIYARGHARRPAPNPPPSRNGDLRSRRTGPRC